MLVYSDELIMIGINQEETVNRISQHSNFKGDLWKKPKQYHGANVGKMTLPNGVESWFHGSAEYCDVAVNNV